MNRQLEALETLYINTAPTPDEVWTPVSSFHVDSLHPEVSRQLEQSMNAVERGQAPVVAVVRGERGSGKTHLLGWTRHRIQARGGFFFYIKLVTGQDFWESAAGSLVDSLYRKDEGGQEQLFRLLDSIARQAQLDPQAHAAITGRGELTRAHVDTFVNGIRGLDRQVGNEAADTARALVLVASSGDAVEIGNSYLALNEDGIEQRSVWGISSRSKPPQRILRDLTRLFALVGPLVFAFDQLDNLITVSEASVADVPSRGRRAARRLSSDIAGGLMEMREEARRTLMLIACQEGTWEKISTTAIRSALDRFSILPPLGAIPDEKTATAIISSRFRAGYESVKFTAPYPTWPVTSAALSEAPNRYTARRLLVRVGEHVAECLRSGTVTELMSLADAKPVAPQPAGVPIGQLEGLTEEFRQRRDEADDVGPLDKVLEDRLVPFLLGAGLQCLMRELDVDETRFLVETDFGRKAALHARLRYIVDEASENEIHWSFRAIAADNPRAAQTRMRNAMAEAGLEAGLSSRRLVLLRNTPFPGGAKSEQLKNDFEARGGLALPVSAADLRTLAALHAMLGKHSPVLDAWLRQERPASHTEILRAVVRELQKDLEVQPSGTSVASDRARQSADEAGQHVPDITIGVTPRGGRPFTVALEQFRKHTVVVGAAGSGKTVLVKRIVEQCALRGVSAIVLDPNDDLGRLTDPWPSPPPGWAEEYARDAQHYFKQVEVVVWTPGLNRGRPLSFHPLPDFGPVLDAGDDFGRLLTSTVATLASYAGVQGRGARATQQVGVLRRALEHYAREGGRTIDGLVELLTEPPGNVAKNIRTRRLALQMADTLDAAMVSDPIFRESDTHADPGMLLTPSPGKSARISVISFVGLSGNGSAQFVSRLQGALFSWFRAHPTRDRPLGGLFVMDEAQNFVPSGPSTPSTDSTVELIRQIRKYGLGVVLASQTPRGINNQALGNTANQFIGRLTAPAQIGAAQDMARSRNSSIDNLGNLTSGTFYAAGEGTAFTKVEVPFCISHHAGPLHEDEVIERAHRIVE